MSHCVNEPNSLRLFVGLPLSSECRAHAGRIISLLGARLPDAFKWVRSENQHLTLRFLGEMPTDRLGNLREHLGTVSFSPFRLQFGGAGVFPGLRRPAVLWVGLVQGREESVRLAASVNEEVVRAGIMDRDTREFVPHLTMGRMKRRRGADKEKTPWEDIVRELGTFQWPVMEVDRIVLWRSILHPEGPEYVALAEFFANGRESSENVLP